MRRLDKLGILAAVLLAAGGLAGLLRANSTQASHVIVLSSPYVVQVQAVQSDCGGRQGWSVCPLGGLETTAWPTVSDGTSSGYVVGDILTTTNGSWITSAGSRLDVAGYAYQWQRCGSAAGACSPIAGANRPRYVLTPADAGFTVRAVVTVTSAGGAGTQPSAPTPPIGGIDGPNRSCTFGATAVGTAGSSGIPTDAKQAVSFKPATSGPLTALSIYLRPSGIAGEQAIRGVVYADSGGAPGALLGASNELDFSERSASGWYALTFPTSPHLVASTPYWMGVISGGSAGIARYFYDSVTPAPQAYAQAGNANLYSSGPSKAFGPVGSTSDRQFSICGIQAADGVPVIAAPPIVTDITAPGAWAVGDVLTASSGTWYPAAAAYSYQWQDCGSSGATCTDIGGATANTYSVAPGQAGAMLRAVVTATNGSGSSSASSALSDAGPATVGYSPIGPPTPSGGWAVEYADAFGAPLGTGPGQDNTVWPSRITGNCTNNTPFNSSEMEVFNCSQVAVDGNGLELTCAYAPQIADGKDYSCGAINTGATGSSPAQLSGYKLFGMQPGHGQEWAIQVVAKFPPNSGEADPGVWLADPSWTWEVDVFEGFGYTAGSGGTWCHATSGNGWIGATDPTWIYGTSDPSHRSIGANQMLCKNAQPSPFDPSVGYHTYTSVIFPNNTMTEYVDGHPQVWDYVSSGGSSYRHGGTTIGPAETPAHSYGGLILSYALRDFATGNPDPHFRSGARTFSVRSVAVYENASAGGTYTVNPGLVAPGTSLRP